MKLRDVPAIPTLIVAAAVGIMIALGVWQLGKVEIQAEKLKRYELAASQTEVRFPSRAEAEQVSYRRSRLICERVLGLRVTAGENAGGASGFAHIAKCETAGGRQAEVVLGWTRHLEEITWSGGEVSGILTPTRQGDVQLVASKPPIPLLKPAKRPDPTARKVDHLAYAGQWFFFALTALVIYILAIRKRKADEATEAA